MANAPGMEESDGQDQGWTDLDLFAPSEEHQMLAQTLRAFVEQEVEPQAAASDRAEVFNHTLFRQAGSLGLLGVTIPESYGGAGPRCRGRRPAL